MGKSTEDKMYLFTTTHSENTLHKYEGIVIVLYIEAVKTDFICRFAHFFLQIIQTTRDSSFLTRDSCWKISEKAENQLTAEKPDSPRNADEETDR